MHCLPVLIAENCNDQNTELGNLCKAKLLSFTMAQPDGSVDSNCEIDSDTPNTDLSSPPATNASPPGAADSCTSSKLSHAPSTDSRSAAHLEASSSITCATSCSELSVPALDAANTQLLDTSDSHHTVLSDTSVTPCVTNDSNYIVISDISESSMSPIPSINADSRISSDKADVVSGIGSKTPLNQIEIGTPHHEECDVLSMNSLFALSPLRSADATSQPQLQNRDQKLTPIKSHEADDRLSSNSTIVIAPILTADMSPEPQFWNMTDTNSVSAKRQLWPDNTPLLSPQPFAKDNRAASDSDVWLKGGQVRIGMHKLNMGSSVSLTPNGFSIILDGSRVFLITADKVISCLACLDTSFPMFFFLVEPSCFKKIRETCGVSAILFNSTSPVLNMRCITVVPKRLTPEDVIATLKCFNSEDGSYFPQVLLPIDATEAVDILFGDVPAVLRQKGSIPNGVVNSNKGCTNTLPSALDSCDNWMQQQLAHEHRKQAREDGWRKRKAQEEKRKQLQEAQKQQEIRQQLKVSQKQKVECRQQKDELDRLSVLERQQMSAQRSAYDFWKYHQEEFKRQEDQERLLAEQQTQMAQQLHLLVAEHHHVQQQLGQLLLQPLSHELQLITQQLLTQQKILQHQILQQQILQQQLLQQQQLQTHKQCQTSVEQQLQYEYVHRQLELEYVEKLQRQQQQREDLYIFQQQQHIYQPT